MFMGQSTDLTKLLLSSSTSLASRAQSCKQLLPLLACLFKLGLAGEGVGAWPSNLADMDDEIKATEMGELTG
jgi:hypothetical protein